MSGDLKIKVRGLCKSFGRKVVLNDLDVHLHGYRPYAAYGRYEHPGNDGEAAAGGA